MFSRSTLFSLRILSLSSWIVSISGIQACPKIMKKLLYVQKLLCQYWGNNSLRIRKFEPIARLPNNIIIVLLNIKKTPFTIQRASFFKSFKQNFSM